MKKSKKLLAILMTSVMILSVFCVSISASNIDGVLIEDVTLREENVKHFKNPDGSYTALVYSSPVHRKDSAGNWQDIDNRMDSGTVSDKQAYVTSDGRTVFSKKISSDDSSVYTLSENGYSIKMSISSVSLENSNAKLSNHASKYVPTADDSLETQYKKVKEIDTTTTVTYKNAISGIDLEYQLSANDIKENIIVRKAQSAYSYTFVYELDGLEAELLDDGSVIFADEDTAEGIYRIPTPYMTDAEGARSEAVAYTLSETAEGVYSLTVTADASWINSEDRELPVTIDPTVTMNDENVYITYINEDSPSTNYSGVGRLSMTQSTMFKMYNLPTLPNGAAIYAASFSVNYSSGSSGTASVGLYRVYGFWTDYDVTWNDLYSENGTLSLSSTAYASANWSLSSTSQTHSFDVKTLVRHWYEGTEDYGVALKYLGDEDCVINVSGTSTTLSISYNILPLPIADGTYYVRNVDEDKYLQKDDDAGVGGINYELWSLDESTGQRWTFKYIYNGYYLITSLDDNKTLERYTYTDGPTELLHMNYVENKDSQQWYVSTTTEGYFKISPKNSLSQYLTAEDAGTNDAATVGFNTAQTDNTDEWDLEIYIPDINLYGISNANHDHITYLETVQTKLYDSGYESTTVYYGNPSSTTYLNLLENSNIFTSRSHGTVVTNYNGEVVATAVILSDGGTDAVAVISENYSINGASDCSAIPSNGSYKGLDLVLFIGCYTGYEVENGNNLPEAAVANGATTAIGFKESINCTAANVWTDLFYSELLDGMTVNDAVKHASQDMSESSGLQYNQIVICGNPNYKLP